MDNAQAFTIAEKLVGELIPGCTRIEIAGSVRREKPEVGDIELVAIPDLRPPRPVFGGKPFSTTLDAILYSLRFDGNDDGLRLYPIKDGDRYKQFWVSVDGGQTQPIKLDLFLVRPPADWGVLYLIRTGPAEFSQWMVTQRMYGGALPNGYYVKDGMVRQIGTNEYLPMPEEIDFLEFCGMPWVEPKNRRPHIVLRKPRIPVHQPEKSASVTGF